MEVSVVVKNSATSIGEAPHWEDETQCLLYVDIWAGDVYQWDSIEDTTSKVHLEGSVGFVIPRTYGGYIVGLDRTLSHLDWDTGVVTTLAEVDHATKNRFNDGKCDPSGRLWAGTMGEEVEPANPELGRGGLFSLERNLQCHKHLNDIDISNGLAWSANTRTMYYIDTIPRKIYAFDFDIQEGKISNQRVAIEFAEGTEDKIGFPDGMCIDAEGKLWVACFGVGAINRFDPNTGELLQSVKLPARWPTSCCFGGANFDELFVTTSKSALTPGEEYNPDQPLGGSVFRVTGLGVKGMPAPKFGG